MTVATRTPRTAVGIPLATPESTHQTPADRAIATLGGGGSIMLVDPDGGRTYVVAAAERVTEEFAALVAVRGRGVLKVAMTPGRVRQLRIPPLGHSDCHAPVDLAGYDRPGIAADRVATLRALADPGLAPSALVVPGHVFPVPTAECDTFDEPCIGRLMTAAAVLAGCAPIAAYCELVTGDVRGLGSREAATRMSRRLGVPLVYMTELAVHCERLSSSLSRVVETTIPTDHGVLSAIGFLGERSGDGYVAFVAGDSGARCRVHVHRRCRAGDVFGSLTCACGEHLRGALREIQAAGSGLIVYCDVDGPGVACPTAGDEAAPSWGFTAEVAAVLHDLGVSTILLTSNVVIDTADLGEFGIDAARWSVGEDAGVDPERDAADAIRVV
jgi:3,4-dihydroxy 2-butanone 4-phosphate synthase/GTP cyclohydrolase II